MIYLYEMKPDTYQIKFDATGKKFLQQTIDKLDKNHQADSTEFANFAKMFETPGENP